MYESFSDALAFVLKNEGSTYTNNPSDAGGPTRYGITLAALREVQSEATAQDVASLTVETVGTIYQVKWWVPLMLDQVRDPVARIMVFDAAVLCGKRAATIFAQSAYHLGHPVDGRMGVVTVSCMNHCADPALAYVEFLHAYQSHLTQRAIARPQNLMFLQGWLERTRRLLPLMFSSGVVKGHAETTTTGV